MCGAQFTGKLSGFGKGLSETGRRSQPGVMTEKKKAPDETLNYSEL